MLSDEHKKIALAHLNDICPDTFDEGEFGPWKFTDLSRNEDRWTLAFDNCEGGDSVRFTWATDCVNAEGSIVDDWFEQISAAILEWERGAMGFDL